MVEIITIGDEILIGQIVDTNSAWIAAELNKIGLGVTQISSVSDIEQHILDAIEEAFQRVDVILMTGGLGPTKDDITKHALCKYYNTKLVYDPTVFENIKTLIAHRKGILNSLTESQAMVPENAEVIQNKAGTAPLSLFQRDGKILVSMPGVPSEMKWAMSNEILPRLSSQYNLLPHYHYTVLVADHAESALAIKLNDWELNLPKHIHLAYLPSPGLVKLRLSVVDSVDSEKDVEKEMVKLRAILGSSIYAEEDVPLSKVIGELLLEKGLTLTTAESCTGGNVAHEITLIPGSSAYFRGSVVAYSNAIKENLLKVPSEILHSYGAVSKPVVEEMAKNALQLMNADVSVAISGIAGPDGGTNDKPVGTVWIAVASNEKVIAREYKFGKIRERNIQQASVAAFSLLKELIEMI